MACLCNNAQRYAPCMLLKRCHVYFPTCKSICKKCRRQKRECLVSVRCLHFYCLFFFELCGKEPFSAFCMTKTKTMHTMLRFILLFRLSFFFPSPLLFSSLGPLWRKVLSFHLFAFLFNLSFTRCFGCTIWSTDIHVNNLLCYLHMFFFCFKMCVSRKTFVFLRCKHMVYLTNFYSFSFFMWYNCHLSVPCPLPRETTQS